MRKVDFSIKSNSQRPRDAPITIRRIPMIFQKDADPVIVLGLPEESFLYLGLSLLLPYLEPYLIRSMQEAKHQITDDRLLADIDLFNGQEAQHYRMHVQFNKSLSLGNFLPLVELEAELEADYRRFTQSRSLQFNLAYAEGFEAFTLALTRFVFQVAAYQRLKASARELFQWHLVEELEHRTVAFDVYQHIYGSYFYRIFISLFAQWHLCRFMLRTLIIMMYFDRNNFVLEYGGLVKTFKRIFPLAMQGIRYFIPKVMNTYLPWYSPHKISMPDYAQKLADEYTNKAR